MDTGRDLFPEGAMVYRRGGGYSATPPRERPVRSPHQTLLEQQLKVYEQECEPADQAPAPRKLNERQWESVVTRLYGNPQAKGVELQAAAENSSVKPTTKKMKHWEVEAAVSPAESCALSFDSLSCAGQQTLPATAEGTDRRLGHAAAG